jgi:hypothetical protein
MAVSDDILKALDKFDLEQMTVAEIREVRNPVLRRVLLSAISTITAALEHTSHGMHTSHAKSEALDIPFGTRIDPSPITGGSRGTNKPQG